MCLVSQNIKSRKLWRSLSLDNLVQPCTNTYFMTFFLLNQIILVICSSPAGLGVWFYIAVYLSCPAEELVQPCVLQDLWSLGAQEQNCVCRLSLRQLVRHRPVQICMHIPLIPVELFIEEARCTYWSFWSIFLCADYTRRRRERITEVSPFIQLVPLLKLYQ